MSAFTVHTGKVARMNRVNVDTDQIIPKQFLKRIERTGFGAFLFYDWRFLDDESPNPAFELNEPGREGVSILVAGENFGCGSSREHAPWALLDYGFQVIIAPNFADIFYNNCFKNGMLPIALSGEEVAELLERSKDVNYTLTVDLVNGRIYDDSGFEATFSVQPYWRELLINGWDEIDLTLQQEELIMAFERSRA
ncbi:MAG: 3-isopropylmalate dehydratase small subunit [Bacilli bacterium]